MPMTWNAEADAKLMAAIMQVCDIKLNGDQMKEVAAAMGSDCTPKAISHRMTHFRKLTTSTKPTKVDNATEKSAKVTKPKANPKRHPKGKRAVAESSPPVDNNEGPLTPPSSVRGKKRARPRDDDDDGLSEDVKIEVGEDIGEGLRAGAPDEEDY